MANEQNDGKNERKYYRIVYPILDRPKLVVNSKEYDVVDICEKGIKFSTNLKSQKICI